jgi:hypothetical protein
MKKYVFGLKFMKIESAAVIYIQSTKSLVKDDADYAKIYAFVNKFCEAGGVGEKL